MMFKLYWRRCRASARSIASLSLAAITFSGGFAAAGIVPLTRSAQVLIGGFAGGAAYSDARDTGDFSPFAASIADSASGGGVTARSSADQQSNINVIDILGSGFLHAQGRAGASLPGNPSDDDFATAESDFDLLFQVVDAPTLWTMSGSLQSSGGGFTFIRLTNEITADQVFGATRGDDAGVEPTSLDMSTTLLPGVYTLSLGTLATGLPDREQTAAFEMSVAFEPGSPQTVPLPPAALLGATGLAACWLYSLLTSAARRRRAA